MLVVCGWGQCGAGSWGEWLEQEGVCILVNVPAGPVSPILAEGFQWGCQEVTSTRQDGKRVGAGVGGPEASRPPGKQEPVAKCRHAVMVLRA